MRRVLQLSAAFFLAALALFGLIALCSPARAQTSIFNGGTGARTIKGARDNLNVLSASDVEASLLGYLKLAGRTADQVVLGLAASNNPLTLRGKPSQTGDLFLIEDDALADIFKVDRFGTVRIEATSSSTPQLQIGITGAVRDHILLGSAGTGGTLKLGSTASTYSFVLGGIATSMNFSTSIADFNYLFGGQLRATHNGSDDLTQPTVIFTRRATQTGSLTRWANESNVGIAAVIYDGTLYGQGLRLEDPAAGTNTITIVSPSAPTTHTLTMPGANAAGALTNNGSGTLSWTAGGGSLADHNHSAPTTQGGQHLKPWASHVDSIPLVVNGQPSQRNKYFQVTDQTAGYGVFAASPGTPADSTLTNSSYIKVGRPDTGRFWWMKGGTTPDFRLDNIAGNSRTLLVLNSVPTYWTDTKETVEFRIGESISSRKDASILGNQGNPFDRLSVMSNYTLFSRETAVASLPTPVVALTPELVRIYNPSTAAGNNAVVPLRVETARAGQTANLIDVVTTAGTKASIGSGGQLTLTPEISDNGVFINVSATAHAANALTIHDVDGGGTDVAGFFSDGALFCSGGFQIKDPSLGGSLNINFSSNAARTLTVPNATGTAVLRSGTSFTAGRVNFATNANVIQDDADLTFTGGDQLNVTKLRVGAAANEVALVGNGADPPAAGAMGKVDRTAQAAAVASTNLTNTTPAGSYLVSYYLQTTTTDAAAGTIRLDITATDDVGSTSQQSVALTLKATGRDRGVFSVRLGSGNITYSTTLTGSIGAARYALTIRCAYQG